MTSETDTDPGEWLVDVAIEPADIGDMQPISEPLTDDQVWGDEITAEGDAHADDPDEDEAALPHGG